MSSNHLNLVTALDLPALLTESRRALWHAAIGEDKRRAHAAARVTNDHRMYELWRYRHERLMRPVAQAEGRFGQPSALRGVGVRLIQGTALVDYLRKHKITGAARDSLVTRFRHQENPRRALLNEHRDYVLAVSSEVGVEHLLRALDDPFGPRLLDEYRASYADSFASFCEAAGDEADEALGREIPLASQALRLRELLSGTPLS